MLISTNYEKAITNYVSFAYYKLRQSVVTNYDSSFYYKLRRSLYKLRHVFQIMTKLLQITTEHPKCKDSSYERVAVTLFRCVT